jgi:DNA replication protein DnaC
MNTLNSDLQSILDRMRERAAAARENPGEMAQLEAARQTAEEERRIANTLIPARFADSVFLEYRVEKGNKTAYEAAMSFAERTPEATGGEGLFLMGDPGCGKTHLVCAAALQRARNGQTGIRYLNVPIFLDRIRASFKFTESAAQDLFEFCCNKASLVILDDFGKEKATDWATERLYVLIESRYQNKLPVLVTSNRTLDELDALGYGATVSRLQQMCRTIKLETRDFRPATTAKG